MDAVFQIINIENGTRSSAMHCTGAKLAEMLRENMTDEHKQKNGVLVLMDTISGEWDFSKAAFVGVPRFLEIFKVNENEQQGTVL